MKFFKLKSETVNPVQFVSFWSKLYDEGKYSERDYIAGLNINGELNVKGIEYLWEWKNGGPLSEKKKPIIKKTIEKLEDINRFRNRPTVKYTDLYSFFDLTNEITNGLIWRIFIIHIARPADQPIFDQHVFRAFNFITGAVDYKFKSPKLFSDYIQYKKFFDELMEKTDDWRSIDKALMAFGQFLKSQFNKGSVCGGVS